MAGGFVSPAAFASAKAMDRAKGRETPHTEAQAPAWEGKCMWCESELGTFDHIMWDCPHIEEGAPQKPPQRMTARLGWPTKEGGGEEAAKKAATRLSWMKHVCKLTWWQRYKPEKKRPEEWKSSTKKQEEEEEEEASEDENDASDVESNDEDEGEFASGSSSSDAEMAGD